MFMQVSAPNDDALGTMDAVAIAAAIATGELTATEAVATAVARLEAVNPHLNAVAGERFQGARLDASCQSPATLLGGVPSLLKDNVDIAGMPTRHGSRATSAAARPTDSEITAQFRATGLIPIAKTTLPEFGLTATTEFTRQQPTRNPWNTGYSCGGSSGGSAALVAAGVVPIAHANDGGGSIRIPAACCAVVGLKPSRNRLCHAKVMEKLPINLVVDGVVSRSVRDTAAFYAAAEQYFHNPDLPAIGHVVRPADKPLRIGFSSAHPGTGACHPAVAAAIEKVAERCASQGHQLEPMAPPADAQLMEDFLLYWARLAAILKYLGRVVTGAGYDRRQLEPLTNHLSRHYLNNCWRSPAAIHRLRTYGKYYQSLFQHYDLLLTPVLASPPCKLDFLALDLDIGTAIERLQQYTPFTPSQNISGTPAISLPLGSSEEGLPIGVQFAAAMGQERRLLEMAYEMEQVMPWHYRPGAAQSMSQHS